MKRKTFTAILLFSFSLVMLHAITPHYHTNDGNNIAVDVSGTVPVAQELLTLFQTIFNPDIGEHHLEQFVGGSYNLLAQLSLMALLVLTTLGLLKLVVPLWHYKPGGYAFNVVPSTPKKVSWQRSHLNLPPPFNY